MNQEIPVGLTFDDVLLVPGASEVLPHDVDVRTQLTREIALNMPLVSAAISAAKTRQPLALRIWQAIRPMLIGKEAVLPRIWAT